MSTVVIIVATAYICFYVLRNFGLFEINMSSTNVSEVIKKERKSKKARRNEARYLSLCTDVANMFRGVFLGPSQKQDLVYYIQRLNLETKTLGRRYTPEEIVGKHLVPFLLSILCLPLAFFNIWFIAIPVVGFIYLAGYKATYAQKIQTEDLIIDDYFIDLYLLLFSKLRQGSRARLQGTLENYIDTLEGQSMTVEVQTMLNFARYFLNLLALYEDHKAVPKIRECYKSATIINFCNIASQALQGIDNFDNLITFKMQLTERKTNMMRKRQQALLRKGERSIYLIWVILFIFIAVGWYSKLPLGAL